MRLAPVNSLTGVLLNFNESEDVPTTGFGPNGTSSRFKPGTLLNASATDDVDTTANVPNWGMAELLYVLYTGAAAINPGRVVIVDKDFAIADCPTAANTGRSVFIALTRFRPGNVTRQGGWVLAAGVAPVQYPTAAVGALGISSATAGIAAANSAGRQILNAQTIIAAAGSFTRQITTVNGSSFVRMQRVNGLYLGQAISGTGIPASSVISSIDPGGNGVVIGSAIGTPVAATASGSVTGTFTHTGFGIVQLDRPFVQGAIT